MAFEKESGLGELLRALMELTDGDAAKYYKSLGWTYRPRYTPVMRRLSEGPCTVMALQQTLSVTQGAISQTVKQMLLDGLIDKEKGKDGRQSLLSLSDSGQALLADLQPHWQATFKAITQLESSLGFPLRKQLRLAADALQQVPFAQRIQQAQNSAQENPHSTESSFFQTGAEAYQRFRPGYSRQLVECLADLVSTSEHAVDIGCGSGQFTQLLTPQFSKVTGIDKSENQLRQAPPAENIDYVLGCGENTGLPNDCADLIVVAQAAHWFDLPDFYREVRRIAKPGAVLALMTYGVPAIAAPANACFQRAYWQDLHHFWSPERYHVETQYQALAFPFETIPLAAPDYSQCLSVEAFIGYMKTWSAYQTACERNQQDRFSAIFEELRTLWENEHKVHWPIAIRAGRVP